MLPVDVKEGMRVFRKKGKGNRREQCGTITSVHKPRWGGFTTISVQYDDGTRATGCNPENFKKLKE